MYGKRLKWGYVEIKLYLYSSKVDTHTTLTKIFFFSIKENDFKC